jgi:hypothetical protein
MNHLHAEPVFQKLWALGFTNCVTSRAYIWNQDKLGEITAKQVLRHRILITASVSGPKRFIDVVIVDASGDHAATMRFGQIHCYRSHGRF